MKPLSWRTRNAAWSGSSRWGNLRYCLSIDFSSHTLQSESMPPATSFAQGVGRANRAARHARRTRPYGPLEILAGGGRHGTTLLQLFDLKEDIESSSIGSRATTPRSSGVLTVQAAPFGE